MVFDFLFGGRRFRSIFGFFPGGDTPGSEEEHVVGFLIAEFQQRLVEAESIESRARITSRETITHGTALAALADFRVAEVNTGKANEALGRVCRLALRFGFVDALQETVYAYLAASDGDAVEEVAEAS